MTEIRIPSKLKFLPGGGFDPSRVKCLFYGDSGGGKTWLAGTFRNAIILNADPGISSISWPIAVWQIDTWNDLVDAYRYLSTENHPYESVIIDSLNEVQKKAEDNVLKSFPNIQRPYNSIPGESDYGKYLFDFDRMVRTFLGLQMNVVLTAQSEQKTFVTDTVMAQLIGKKTARNINRLMDVIGFVYRKEKGKHITVFGASSDYVTKDRSGRLPPEMLNCTHAALMREWQKPRTEPKPELITDIPWEQYFDLNPEDNPNLKP